MMGDTEQVRAIAKAICKSRSCEGFNCCQWPANGGRLPKDCPVERGGYDDAAQAALDCFKLAAAHSLLSEPDREAALYGGRSNYGPTGGR